MYTNVDSIRALERLRNFDVVVARMTFKFGMRQTVCFFKSVNTISLSSPIEIGCCCSAKT